LLESGSVHLNRACFLTSEAVSPHRGVTDDRGEGQPTPCPTDIGPDLAKEELVRINLPLPPA